MKTIFKSTILLAVAGLSLFTSCKDDNDSHDVLLALSTGKKMSDPPKIDDDDETTKGGRLIYTGEEWFKPLAEMAKIFPEHPEVLRNTLEVAEFQQWQECGSECPEPESQFAAVARLDRKHSTQRAESVHSRKGCCPRCFIHRVLPNLLECSYHEHRTLLYRAEGR